MQALVMRASALDAITDRQKRSFFQMISAKGYRKREPGELPAETPTIVADVLQTHLGPHGYTVAELSKIARLSEPEFRDTYGLHERPARRALRVVGDNRTDASL